MADISEISSDCLGAPSHAQPILADAAGVVARKSHAPLAGGNDSTSTEQLVPRALDELDVDGDQAVVVGVDQLDLEPARQAWVAPVIGST